ncbi:MAG: NAD(P)H-hydrate dehydratase [Coriobacteriales bacterium]|nr:NAD(P)H-hydrate dehydratase [Coriobacteriales bacterium]
MQKAKITNHSFADSIPKLSLNAYKYSRGQAIILAGSNDYYGAAVLATLASERTGAGYTKLVTPRNCGKLASAHIISSPIIFLENNANYFTKADLKVVEQSLCKVNALLVGPGIAQQKCTRKFLENLLLNTKIKCPIVLDADALNIIAKIPKILRKCKNKNIIITPHEGEAHRLAHSIKKPAQTLKMPACDNQLAPHDYKRLKLAARLAHYYKVTCILKGHHTIIANRDSFYIDTLADARLAKAGTSDVLAGITVSLLAQGLSTFDSAVLAVDIHSKASQIATKNQSELSLTPLDLVENIGYAIKEIQFES